MINGSRIVAGVLTLGVLSWGWCSGANPVPPVKPILEIPSFGVLKSPTAAEVKAQADAWAKTRPPLSAEQQKAMDALWAGADSYSDKLAQTFALLDPEAAKILNQAKESVFEAPQEIPALLKDASKPMFFRANLAVTYSRILSQNKVYELALDTLKLFRPEQVADPSSYLFHRAVAEYSLMMKKEADDTINRLLDDVSESPERYRNVAALMAIEMMVWRDKDLGWISRKMENIQRRLDLGQGGNKTQKIQKEVVVRLDEMIKEMEDQAKKAGDGAGGPGAPGPGNGPPGNNVQSSAPQQDSIGGNGGGAGQVDQKRVRELAEVWGKLPERDRARAMVELTRSLPPKYREAVEIYFKRLGDANPAP